MDVFNKLKTLCNSCALVFSLAQEGTAVPQVYVEALAYLELYSRIKAFVNISWRHPPAHSWYRSEVLLYILKGIGKTKQLWLA
ncbi:hypothetical protein AVEN_107711-1 [Araneus ventricosus]|uniref:Uncharacterized protein n=1 Tax=Araneus ventricosus TaxID=182803 RepID=A0A4Y2STS2_ARAVE|nr:hypothetical protein AVEN_107711-1 [Araneus ventricosus]